MNSFHGGGGFTHLGGAHPSQQKLWQFVGQHDIYGRRKRGQRRIFEYLAGKWTDMVKIPQADAKSEKDSRPDAFAVGGAIPT